MDNTLYEQDFYAWAKRNSELLRAGRFSEVDVDNLAEELESMGRSEKRALVARMAVLIAHLLKWRFQPALRSNSLKYTIKEQRRRVGKILEDSPSLKHQMEALFPEAYADAILLAAKDTGLTKEDFPSHCPYTFDLVMEDNYWPE
jgi:hypothetical protein